MTPSVGYNNNNGHFYGVSSLARSRAQCAVQKDTEKCMNTYMGWQCPAANSKHWFTTSFLVERCRKAMLGVWSSSWLTVRPPHDVKSRSVTPRIHRGTNVPNQCCSYGEAMRSHALNVFVVKCKKKKKRTWKMLTHGLRILLCMPHCVYFKCGQAIQFCIKSMCLHRSRPSIKEARGMR